jgi:nucleotide-binding universal stress UspA family protein
VAIDSCETTTVATPIVQRTIELASALAARVWIVHIVPASRPAPYNIDNSTLRKEIVAEYRHEHEFLQQLAKCMHDRGIEAQALMVQGNTVHTILKESERLEIDLIIAGCHKQGILYGALLDDTEEGLLSKCTRPVMFIPMNQ